MPNLVFSSLPDPAISLLHPLSSRKLVMFFNLHQSSSPNIRFTILILIENNNRQKSPFNTKREPTQIVKSLQHTKPINQIFSYSLAHPRKKKERQEIPISRLTRNKSSIPLQPIYPKLWWKTLIVVAITSGRSQALSLLSWLKTHDWRPKTHRQNPWLTYISPFLSPSRSL